MPVPIQSGPGQWLYASPTYTDQCGCMPDTSLVIGPSGVRALPVAAGTNEGGHYFAYFSSYLLTPIRQIPIRDCHRILKDLGNLHTPVTRLISTLYTAPSRW